MADSGFFTTNIREYEAFPGELSGILQEYACPLNEDVERFLKQSALDFARRNQSVTYLVFSAEDGMLLGYFTIAIKAITISAKNLSNTVRRKIARISEIDTGANAYLIPAFLIAQLGKNFANGANRRIKGSQLLDMAWNVIKEIQYSAGGVVAFLETAPRDELLAFYAEQSGFRQFDTRKSRSSDRELVQLLKFL